MKAAGKKQNIGLSKQKPSGYQTREISVGFFKVEGIKAFFLAFALLFVVAALVFKDFLLLKKIFLYKDIGSDSLNETLPFLTHFSNYLKSYGRFSWSFNPGMGANITPLASGDPLDFLLYFAGASHIAPLMGVKQFLETVISGILFYGYLRLTDKSFIVSVIGGLMFGFCGFLMVGSAWNFTLQGIVFVLLLIGFERMFRYQKPFLFVLPVVIISISAPFYLFIYAEFMLVYAVFRYYQEQCTGIRGLIILLLKMGVFALIGVAIAFPLFIEQIKIMAESPRVGGSDSLFSTLLNMPLFDFADSTQIGTFIHRFFSSEILGSGSKYKGWGNIMEGPDFYCGIPCLLLLPLLFSFVDRKQLKIFAIVLGIWMIPVIFPWFRYAFWLFSGDYYRLFSLFVAFIFIYYSVLSLEFIIRGNKLNLPVLMISAVVLIIIRKLSFFENRDAVNNGLELAVDFFVPAYAAMIYWISREKKKALPLTIFMVVFCIEIIWFSRLTISRDSNITAEEMQRRTGYNDYSLEAIDYIKKHDVSFFRLDKTYGSSPAKNSSLNDGMMQDYYGTTCYSSFNQKYYIQYLRSYGVISLTSEIESRWSAGLINRQFLQTINGVKYILTKNYTHKFTNPVWDSVTSFHDVTILRNKFALPLGFGYSRYIRYSDFEKMRNFQKDVVSLSAAVINDNETGRVRGLQRMPLKDTTGVMSFNTLLYKKLTDSLRQDTLKITDFKPFDIKGHTSFKTDKLLYLAIPYDKGWHIYIDGKEQDPIIIAKGMMGCMPGTGDHSIEILYKPLYRKEASWVSMTCLVFFAGLWFRSLKPKK